MTLTSRRPGLGSGRCCAPRSVAHLSASPTERPASPSVRVGCVSVWAGAIRLPSRPPTISGPCDGRVEKRTGKPNPPRADCISILRREANACVQREQPSWAFETADRYNVQRLTIIQHLRHQSRQQEIDLVAPTEWLHDKVRFAGSVRRQSRRHRIGCRRGWSIVMVVNCDNEQNGSGMALASST